MSTTKINLSISKSYASGFINEAVSVNEFAALQECRIFHQYNESAVRQYARTFYSGNSHCYNWLCMLNYYNQFTGDLLSRKCLRPYLWFQYVFFDLHTCKPLTQLIGDIEVKPNVLTLTGNRAVRLFYILDEPQPLTSYRYIYACFLPFVAIHGVITDVSTPKVIRCDRGAVINKNLHPVNVSYQLY